MGYAAGCRTSDLEIAAVFRGDGTTDLAGAWRAEGADDGGLHLLEVDP